jgi:hypothetical protein
MRLFRHIYLVSSFLGVILVKTDLVNDMNNNLPSGIDYYSLLRAFLTAAAISFISMGFMTNAFIPICLARSWSTGWL